MLYKPVVSSLENILHSLKLQFLSDWGNEEREGKMVFEKGVGFDLTIINESYGFQIFVNDERFCTFAHRGNLQKFIYQIT